MNNQRKTHTPSHLGKVPPQALELEEAVLGALMLERDAIYEVVDILKPHIFYKDSHQLIFEGIISLFSEGDPIDLLTVTSWLRKTGNLEIAGGAYYVTELTNKVASAANIEYHSRIILEQYIKRELIRVSSELQRRAYDDTEDCFKLLDFGQVSLLNLDNTGASQSVVELKDSMMEAFQEMQSNMNKKNNNLTTGVLTPITRLNQHTGGWQPGQLIIIAGRPAMGKTGFAVACARSAAGEAEGILFFTLEMSSIELTNRIIVQESQITSTLNIQSGDLSESDIHAMVHRTRKMVKHRISIDDNVAQGLNGIRSKAMKMKQKGNLKMIVVDYLQLLSDEQKGSNREQEISRISRGLKNLAKELHVPVLALAQLSRDVEKRGGDHKPKLSDLRESGSLEQDANMVIFLYRPEYYGITEYIMPDGSRENTHGLAMMLISKHRNGWVGEIPMRFIGKFIDFVDYTTYETPDKPDDFKWPTGEKNF